ncbi:MAG: exosortase/archaeosortase family protein [Armatimonadota bacterium]|nr:MAG: exosortase/archaeosortase family protein [Armatimonadota bacterium]
MAVAVARPRPVPILAVAVVAAGAWLYAPALSQMVRAWATDDHASHGFLVAPIAAYLVWTRWERIVAAYRGGAAAAGMACAAAALLMYLAGRWMEVNFLAPLSLVLMIGAQMLYFGGWGVAREVGFPYAFLFFMVPWPDLLVEFISFPMQLLSAKYATMITGLLGIPVSRSGVDIHLANYSFTVAVPCSGMKALVALMALAALIAYVARGPMWRRVVLFALGVPVALAANVARVTLILVIATLAGARAAEGFFHGASGMLVFVFALAGMILVARALGLRGIAGGSDRGAPDASGG